MWGLCLWCLCVCGVYLLRYMRSVLLVSVCLWSVSVSYIWGHYVWCLCVCGLYLFQISDLCMCWVSVSVVCIYLRYLRSLCVVSVFMWSVSILKIWGHFDWFLYVCAMHWIIYMRCEFMVSVVCTYFINWRSVFVVSVCLFETKIFKKNNILTHLPKCHGWI